MKTFLHAAAAVLTILLFFFHPRCTMAAVCYKRMQKDQPYFQTYEPKEFFSVEEMACKRSAGYMLPRYKKDPEIDVDNEQIGQDPIE